MLVETLASALGVHVFQRYSNLDSASVTLPAVRGALDARHLARVREFIEANLGKDVTVERLAKEACLSSFHFARAFKAATGVGPHRYLTDRRIEKAKRWIADGQRAGGVIVSTTRLSGEARTPLGRFVALLTVIEAAPEPAAPPGPPKQPRRTRRRREPRSRSPRLRRTPRRSGLLTAIRWRAASA